MPSTRKHISHRTCMKTGQFPTSHAARCQSCTATTPSGRQGSDCILTFRHNAAHACKCPTNTRQSLLGACVGGLLQHIMQPPSARPPNQHAVATACRMFCYTHHASVAQLQHDLKFPPNQHTAATAGVDLEQRALMSPVRGCLQYKNGTYQSSTNTVNDCELQHSCPIHIFLQLVRYTYHVSVNSTLCKLCPQLPPYATAFCHCMWMQSRM